LDESFLENFLHLKQVLHIYKKRRKKIRKKERKKEKKNFKCPFKNKTLQFSFLPNVRHILLPTWQFARQPHIKCIRLGSVRSSHLPFENALGWLTCVQVSLYLLWLANSHDLFVTSTTLKTLEISNVSLPPCSSSRHQTERIESAARSKASIQSLRSFKEINMPDDWLRFRSGRTTNG